MTDWQGLGRDSQIYRLPSRRASSRARALGRQVPGARGEAERAGESTVLNDAVSSRPTVVVAAPCTRPGPLYYPVKRCLDWIVAALLLVLASPLMLLIVVLIKLDSPGPVIFSQERVGSRRRSCQGTTCWEIRPFRFYKFRSMVYGADQALHQDHIKAFAAGQVTPVQGSTAKFKLQNDPRVTWIGRILRKTSLDELPQLVNVLRGEMSLVGPRPVPAYEVAEYQAWHYERLAAMPGITGLWQVMGRSEISFDDMIRLDLDYVRHPSLYRDFKILLLTIPAVVQGRGAE